MAITSIITIIMIIIIIIITALLDTEKGVGYPRLEVLAGYEPHHQLHSCKNQQKQQ